MKHSLFIFLLQIVSVYCATAQAEFSLDQAIDYAIKSSNAMKAEVLNVMDAEARVQEVKSSGKPKLNLGVNYNYNFIRPIQPTEDFISPAIFDILNQFVFQQPIDPGPPETFEITFARKHTLAGYADFQALLFDPVFLKGLKAAKVSVDLERLQSKISERDIIIEVTKAYLGTLVAYENKTIIENNISVVETMLHETTQIYKAGFAEQLDVTRLELSRDKLNMELENLTQLIEVSKNLVQFHMNYPFDKDILLTDNLQSMLDQIQLEDDLMLASELRYTDRPEYAVINKAIELDQLDIERLGLRWPILRANINIQESLQRDDLLDGAEPGFLPAGFIGLNLKYPLIDGREKKSKQERAKIRQELKELQRKDFEKGMELEVINSMTAHRNAKKTLQNREDAVTTTESIYDITQIKFREGVGSSVEISVAENDLYQAQAAYISALYDVVLTKTDLDIALGKLNN